MAEMAKAQMPLAVSLGFLEWLWGWVVAFVAGVFYGATVLFFNFLQVLSLLIVPFSRKAFRSFNRLLADVWWGWCVTGSEKVFGVTPVFSGDDVPSGENAILFANHQQMPY